MTDRNGAGGAASRRIAAQRLAALYACETDEELERFGRMWLERRQLRSEWLHAAREILDAVARALDDDDAARWWELTAAAALVAPLGPAGVPVHADGDTAPMTLEATAAALPFRRPRGMP
jgi:hypothetical protein